MEASSSSSSSVLISYLLLSFVYFPTISALSSNPLYTKYIKNKCTTTTYPTLCRTSLYPLANTVRSNPWKLCNAALAISVQSARNTSSFISMQLKKKGLTKIEVAIIKDCTDNLANSIVELKQSIQTMSRVAKQKHNATVVGAPPSAAAMEYMEFQMSNVKTWVSAAITDEGTCGDDLDGSKVRAGLKKTIRRGIGAVARLTSNALSLINSMIIN